MAFSGLINNYPSYGGVMSTLPLLQNVHEISSCQYHDLGALHIDGMGRKFRYASIGAAIAAGQIAGQSAATAQVVEPVTVAAGAVGDTSVACTAVGTTIVANQLAGGTFMADSGEVYQIVSNTATASTALTIKLAEPLRVAPGTSANTCFLYSNPYFKPTICAATTRFAVGLVNVAITANDHITPYTTVYMWLQTTGLASVYCASTTIVTGSGLMLGSGGAVVVSTPVAQIIGYSRTAISGAAGWALVDLCIES